MPNAATDITGLGLCYLFRRPHKSKPLIFRLNRHRQTNCNFCRLSGASPQTPSLTCDAARSGGAAQKACAFHPAHGQSVESFPSYQGGIRKDWDKAPNLYKASPLTAFQLREDTKHCIKNKGRLNPFQTAFSILFQPVLLANSPFYRIRQSH